MKYNSMPGYVHDVELMPHVMISLYAWQVRGNLQLAKLLHLHSYSVCILASYIYRPYKVFDCSIRAYN